MALEHGYTNETVLDGDLVTKTFTGGDGVARREREELALRSLRGRFPVPRVVDASGAVLRTSYVDGHHGQELIDAGHGEAVMAALGNTLREVQAITPDFLPEYRGEGVLVHNDFGPNNVRLNRDLSEVVLLNDWEWTTVGSPLTDLAWTEFVVRMHHPQHTDILAVLFDAYGARPQWRERQQAMLDRAAAHEAWVARWRPSRSFARAPFILGWAEL